LIQLDSNRLSPLACNTSLADIEFVSFDIETTGLSPFGAKIVELSGVKFKLGNSNFSEFSTLVDPECSIPAQVTAIHGITNKMVAGQPTIAEVIPKFFNWVGSDNIVMAAHNAGFDISFIKFAIAKYQLAVPNHQVIDTLSLARQSLQEVPNYKLSTLVELLGLSSGEHHRALADSHHVRSLLMHMLNVTEELKTWGHLTSQNCVLHLLSHRKSPLSNDRAHSST